RLFLSPRTAIHHAGHPSFGRSLDRADSLGAFEGTNPRYVPGRGILSRRNGGLRHSRRAANRDSAAAIRTCMSNGRKRDSRAFLTLLRPDKLLLTAGFGAACGESLVDLLGPWPLKIVLDHVIQNRPIAPWLQGTLSLEGVDKSTILAIAAGAALAIAAIGALCAYGEKHFITTVAQWVTHDLRKTLYFHIQRMSLSYHDHTSTGDLISRLTSDIDSVQTFITSGLLSALVNALTLAGMVGVMFYLNWRFTLIALSIAPALFVVIYRFTRRGKNLS